MNSGCFLWWPSFKKEENFAKKLAAKIIKQFSYLKQNLIFKGQLNSMKEGGLFWMKKKIKKQKLMKLKIMKKEKKA